METTSNHHYDMTGRGRSQEDIPLRLRNARGSKKAEVLRHVKRISILGISCIVRDGSRKKTYEFFVCRSEFPLHEEDLGKELLFFEGLEKTKRRNNQVRSSDYLLK
jgi:hypothetical protein